MHCWRKEGFREYRKEQQAGTRVHVHLFFLCFGSRNFKRHLCDGSRELLGGVQVRNDGRFHRGQLL